MLANMWHMSKILMYWKVLKRKNIFLIFNETADVKITFKHQEHDLLDTS